MTLEANAPYAYLVGNGLTTEFNFSFKAFSDKDGVVGVDVYLEDNDPSSDTYGDRTLQTLTTHYSIVLGVESGGTVTFLSTPTSLQKVLIMSRTALTQNKNYSGGGSFPASSHEDGLDKLTRILQEKELEIDMSLKVPIFEAETFDPELPKAEIRANKMFAFDADGNIEMITALTQDTLDDILEAETHATNAAASAGAAASSALAAAASAAAAAAAVAGINLPTMTASNAGQPLIANSDGTAYEFWEASLPVVMASNAGKVLRVASGGTSVELASVEDLDPNMLMANRSDVLEKGFYQSVTTIDPFGPTPTIDLGSSNRFKCVLASGATFPALTPSASGEWSFRFSGSFALALASGVDGFGDTHDGSTVTNSIGVLTFDGSDLELHIKKLTAV